MFVFVNYMIMVGISIAFFYLLYRILLVNDTSYKSRRLILLLSVIASFAIPLISSLYPAVEIISTPLINVQEYMEIPLSFDSQIGSETTAQESELNSQINMNWNQLIYWLVVIVLCIRWIIGYRTIIQWLRKANIIPYRAYWCAILNENISPFSCWKYIFLSRDDYEQNKRPILLHEEEHIRKHHSIDVFVMELVCYLQWFNPFVWLLKSELKLVHEYQADQAVLNKGIDATQYQLLILEKAVGERRFATARYFSQNPISKRLKMMKNKKNKRWGAVKGLLFIPVGLLLLQAFTRPEIVDRVNELAPISIQIDSSEIWLKQWTPDNISNLATFPEGTVILGIADKGEKHYLKARNAMSVLQNRYNKYLVQGELTKKQDLEQIIIDFLSGKGYRKIKPPEVTEVELSNGKKAMVSKGVIMYLHDRGTSKSEVESTIRIIGKAFLYVRKEKSKERFNKDYFSLNKTERLEIDEMIPIQVSLSSGRKKITP